MADRVGVPPCYYSLSLPWLVQQLDILVGGQVRCRPLFRAERHLAQQIVATQTKHLVCSVVTCCSIEIETIEASSLF